MTKLVMYDDFTTTSWAGGTTTELLIYPEDAVYKELNFCFRLSTATVNIENGIFTCLPGIERKLLLLEGSILLTFDGKTQDKWMKQGDMAHFFGDTKTVSAGTGRDFNLMMSKGTKGDVSLITLLSEEKEDYADYITKDEDPEEKSMESGYCAAVYVTEGTVCFHTGEEKITLKKGQLGVLMTDTSQQVIGYCIQNEAKEKASFVKIKIFWKY